ncbi:MAG: STAS domain-containing protein [Candidatus Marinimicrobia bacterium]|nr:STAS domain-containing protein [Candidatus Neomarinimicrobiota bacterium]
MSTAHYQYTKVDNKYIIKLMGELKYKWSSGFSNFIKKIFHKGDFDDIIVDISEASYIDSTNIGLLAQIARFSLQKFSHKLPVIVDTDGLQELLRDMGFAEICEFVKMPDNFDYEYKSIQSTQGSKENLGKMILDAHKTLTEINENNKQQFKDVVNLLEKQTGKEKDKDETE